MRTKKSILLVCGNEVTASVLAFQMQLWGYAVTKEHSYKDAPRNLRKHHYDLVLMLPQFDATWWPAFAQQATEMQPVQRFRYAKLAIFDSQGKFPETLAPEVERIVPLSFGVEHLRHSIAILMVRKRGPKGQVAA